jgi:hypothetical protein
VCGSGPSDVASEAVAWCVALLHEMGLVNLWCGVRLCFIRCGVVRLWCCVSCSIRCRYSGELWYGGVEALFRYMWLMRL